MIKLITFVILSTMFQNSLCCSGRNCVASPSGCTESTCFARLHWSEYGSAYNVSIKALISYFSLVTQENYWIGIGLSDTGTMEDSQITLCTMSENKISVVQVSGYSHGVSPVTIGSSLTSQVQLQMEDEFISCQFLLHKSLIIGDPKYIFVGSGPVEDNSILYHLATPLVFPDLISLAEESDSSSISSGITDARVLFHASAMITGYGIFLVIGMYSSRYLKPIFDTAWYKIHTNVLFGMVFIVSAGIASILMKEKTIRTGVHELLGFLIIGLTIVQIMVGSCRPYKKHNLRNSIVNVHLLLACFIFILVIINIFIGLAKSHLGIPNHIFIIQGIYIIWVVFGSIVGNEVLKYLYCSNMRLYVKKLKVYTLINIGIILLYGCTIILLLNVVE